MQVPASGQALSVCRLQYTSLAVVGSTAAPFLNIPDHTETTWCEATRITLSCASSPSCVIRVVAAPHGVEVGAFHELDVPDHVILINHLAYSSSSNINGGSYHEHDIPGYMALDESRGNHKGSNEV